MADSFATTSQSLALAASSREPRVDAFPNPFALEFREAAQDAEHEPSSGATGVDALTDGREAHARIRERLDGVYQVGEAPAKPIQLPAHDNTHLPAFGIGHQPVKGWSAIFCTADTGINVFGFLPPTSVTVAAEFQQLVLACLVAG